MATTELPKSVDDQLGAIVASGSAILEGRPDPTVQASPSVPPPPAAPAAPAAPVPPAAQPVLTVKVAPPDPAGAFRVPSDVRSMASEPEYTPESFEPETPGVSEPPTDSGRVEDDPDAPPEVKTNPKAASAWAKGKQHERQLEQEKKQLALRAQQLEAALKEEREKKNLEAQTEVEQLRKQVQEYEDRVGQLDIAQTKSFRERYDTVMERLHAKNVSLLARTGMPEAEANDLATKLIATRGDIAQIQSLVSQESPMVQSALLQNTQELLDTAQQRQQALASWRDTRAALQAQSERSSTAETTQTIVEATTKASKDLVLENSWLFAESQENQEWNQRRDELIRQARHVLREGRPADVAKMVLEGAAATWYRRWGEHEHARAEKLAAELQARVGSLPGLGVSTVAEAAGGTANAPAKPRSENPDKWLDENLGR